MLLLYVKMNSSHKNRLFQGVICLLLGVGTGQVMRLMVTVSVMSYSNGVWCGSWNSKFKKKNKKKTVDENTETCWSNTMFLFSICIFHKIPFRSFSEIRTQLHRKQQRSCVWILFTVYEALIGPASVSVVMEYNKWGKDYVCRRSTQSHKC